MNEHERAATVAFDWGLALAIAAAAGWCALAVGSPPVAAVAALSGFVGALGAMHWVARRPCRHRLPAFALPEWPEWTDPRAADALPEGVVRLPVRRLPTPGELDARIQLHLEERPGKSAEIIPLGADAGTALRQALAELRHAQS